jgi:hypothetical protein
LNRKAESAKKQRINLAPTKDSLPSVRIDVHETDTSAMNHPAMDRASHFPPTIKSVDGHSFFFLSEKSAECSASSWRPVFMDELTFATWKREQPHGRVLRLDEKIAAQGKYAPSDWEERMLHVPVVTQVNAPALGQRELVVGITANSASCAYPFTALQKQNPIIDQLGGVPLVIVLGEDGKSIRAFDRTIGGSEREFFLKPDSLPLRVD